MKLSELTLKGVTRYSKPVTVNFAEIGAGTIAIVAPNGLGKTSLMESTCPGVLYGYLPSYAGNLADTCNGRDAFIELKAEMGGKQYRAKVQIDAERRTSEGYLWDADGNPVKVTLLDKNGKPEEVEAAGKISNYLRVTEHVFGSKDLVMTSVFLDQAKSADFMDFPKSKKIEMFAQMLGCEEDQRISDHAKDQAKALGTEIEVLSARIRDLEAQVSQLEDRESDGTGLRTQLTSKSGELAYCEDALGLADKAVTAAALSETTIRSRIDALQEQAQGLERAQHERAEKLQRYQKLDTDAKAEKAVIDRRPEIEAAEQNVKELESQLAQAKTALAAAEMAQEELHQREQAGTAIRLEIAANQRTREELIAKTNLAHQQAIGDLQQTLSGAEAALASAETTLRMATEGQAVQRAENKVRFAAQAVKVAEEQVEAQRKRGSLIGEVPCAGLEIAEGCKLLSGAREERAKLPEVEAHLAEAKRKLGDEQAALEAAKEQQQVEIETATKQVAEITGQVETARSALTRARETKPELPGEVAGYDAAIAHLEESLAGYQDVAAKLQDARCTVAEARQAVQALETSITPARETAALKGRLADAERRYSGLEADRAIVLAEGLAIAERIKDIEAKLEERSQLEKKLANAFDDKARAEQTKLEAAAKVRELTEALGAIRGRIQTIEALFPELAEGKVRLDLLIRDQYQWLLIARGLGKEGTQALAIDGAGPEVADIMNDLLSVTYGDRFSVEIRTLKPKADGKGWVEDFDIIVHDSHRGRKGEMKRFSGGEKVILNEAFALAIVIFNCRKSGKRYETIFRDETTGALDADHARRYLRMLNRARALGGFHQIIFITHDQEIWEGADHRIFVRPDASLEVA